MSIYKTAETFVSMNFQFILAYGNMYTQLDSKIDEWGPLFVSV